MRGVPLRSLILTVLTTSDVLTSSNFPSKKGGRPGQGAPKSAHGQTQSSQFLGHIR